ncbi:hypothetical protein ABEB36_007266 [Hypothenemus hampei]|uniref:Hexosyltransferase n=1 Tax=Hypothenemus hampei TaxID=57062 RepID=A0ABD1ETE2_HYPHA
MILVTKKFLFENVYLFLGIIIGLYISSFITTTFDSCQSTENAFREDVRFAQEIINSSINRLAPRILPEKPADNKKPNFVRPRYYSTELGIREKLFVGIFTSEDKVNTQALQINSTIGHLVDKIKYFITAQYKFKSKFNLTGLVGFTDARHKYRPFQVIKYVADTYLNNYDYYFFTNDFTFVNAHRLRDIVNKISVSMDVYLGATVPDSSYCNLGAGIVLSNSVLKAARQNLEWCIMNTVSEDYSENIGHCIYHSTNLYCQNEIQEQTLPSFKLKHFNLSAHLKGLTKNQGFNQAVTIHPVVTIEDISRLNSYFLKQRLDISQKHIAQLSSRLTESWPPGQRTGAIPASRFDIPRQQYFNSTHIFFPDDFTVSRSHSEPERLDIENIMKHVIQQVMEDYKGSYEFRRIVNGYKKFDLSRGMDYTLDLAFKDLNNGREIIKRFEVCKPLGTAEFVPVPYVTENSRVFIVVPIEEADVDQAEVFLKQYNASIMEKKEKTLLLLVLLYQYNSDSKGSGDVFVKLKQFVRDSSLIHTNDDAKISWLSIRLPEGSSMTFEKNKILNFAVIDLALKKIGLGSLTLFVDVYAIFTIDFLNRVRMNTIEDFQIYSPIPFRQYNPKISQIIQFDVNKMSGHFDRELYNYISFYGRDYVTARKNIQNIVPLIRVDNDIARLQALKDHNGNIFEMFVQHGTESFHCMRATEMNLKVTYHEDVMRNSAESNKFYGNEAQLAKFLLNHQESIPELM